MHSDSTKFPLLGMLAALAGFLVLQVIAYARAGVFEYPLDDVYIHLAMASNIVQGTYGVNAGEAASAASSILYPLLLLPFPDTEFQRLLPLFWNTLAVAGCGWIWGLIIQDAKLTGVLGIFFAIATPICLNISGVGFTGMEAAPHILLSLMTVLGLWRSLTGRGVAPWFIAAAILAPLLRYEGLGLSLMSAAVLFLSGERRVAVIIATAALGLMAAFSLFLAALGLPPIPGSILAKMVSLDVTGGLLDRIAIGVSMNLTKSAGKLLAVLVLLSLLLLAVFPALRRGLGGQILIVAVLSAMAHLVIGQIGWMHRYEPYIVVSLLGAMLLACSTLQGWVALSSRCAAVMVVLAGLAIYLPSMRDDYTWNPRAIHLQQAQMARFARDYLKAPVAVNDLGRVAWRNPNYVLDLWGLGSDKARRVRFDGPPPPKGWAAPLALEHQVQAAMIYDKWFGGSVGDNWVPVANLTMAPPRGVLGDWNVTFYATDPTYVPHLSEKLLQFEETLPSEAILTLAGEDGA